MSPARPRRPPNLDDRALENAALHYLERYAASSAQLRRMLRRRVLRAAALGPVDKEAAHTRIDRLIERYRAAGLLDDRRFAEAQTASLRRAGASGRRIRQRLSAKGVAPALIEHALENVDTETGSDDLAAACILARRRRLGPYRKTGSRDAYRQKDLASLARAGFSLDIARRVLAADTADELERLARGEDS